MERPDVPWSVLRRPEVFGSVLGRPEASWSALGRPEALCESAPPSSLGQKFSESHTLSITILYWTNCSPSKNSWYPEHRSACNELGTLANSQIRPVCHRIHVFTTKNAHSLLLFDKVRQNWPGCHRAVWQRIQEVEKVYRTRVRLNILMFSKSQMRRHFGF